ncbi:MAG: hypothetical protein NTX01_06895 [Candidatus Omnitrophica bacterium]|nr:hypothetical protein [Candidatus Omnitrophota bacterium]
MANILENKKRNSKSQTTKALKDLVIIVIVCILIFILSYFFDVFVFIVKFLEKHPRKIVYIDEVITALLTLSIALAIFAWRRCSELKKETTERIKLQEEIISIANTNAEVERIIGKQLRCEIELHRQEEKNALSLKLNVKNKSK